MSTLFRGCRFPFLAPVSFRDSAAVGLIADDRGSFTEGLKKNSIEKSCTKLLDIKTICQRYSCYGLKLKNKTHPGCNAIFMPFAVVVVTVCGFGCEDSGPTGSTLWPRMVGSGRGIARYSKFWAGDFSCLLDDNISCRLLWCMRPACFTWKCIKI